MWNVDPQKSELPEAKRIRWVGNVVHNYICHEKRDNDTMKKTKKRFKVMLKTVRTSQSYMFIL